MKDKLSWFLTKLIRRTGIMGLGIYAMLIYFAIQFHATPISGLEEIAVWLLMGMFLFFLLFFHQIDRTLWKIYQELLEDDSDEG